MIWSAVERAVPCVVISSIPENTIEAISYTLEEADTRIDPTYIEDTLFDCLKCAQLTGKLKDFDIS